MKPINRIAALAVVSGAIPNLAHADFFADSKGALELRNFYFNRDFRQDGSRDKAEEWAQGFLLNIESGYTEGPVGFGVDALGMLGVKLDSGGGTYGSGLLPNDGNPARGSEDEYSKLAATAKARFSRSTLRLGDLRFRSPIVSSNDSRLLPTAFRGGLVNIQEIDNLTLQGGKLTAIRQNSSSNYEDMVVFGKASDAFIFAGGDYKFTPNLSAGLHYGNLEDVYKQYYGTLNYVLPLGDKQSLKFDLRYARSTEDGNFRNLDNKAFGSMVTYSLGGHAFGAAYQRMSGDDAFPFISDPYLVNFVQINNFANAEEKSWQLRYDYNFAAIGLPGLTFMTRYISGDDVAVAGREREGKEWERNMDIGYVIQSGPLKDLGIKWRNATVRSNFGNDLDENRLILTYSLALW
ncbi:OprD family porin [Stutzerimonas azotifigens]|uniref:OprD family porin n=1 Tax=Stutzerimonas azotifigens TaxID=291995 RepID=UPI0003FEBA9D|nr:OprD family porin [Stutzerimonas azotifigens]